MIQSSCGGKNGKLNDTIEVSALWSIMVLIRSGTNRLTTHCERDDRFLLTRPWLSNPVSQSSSSIVIVPFTASVAGITFTARIVQGKV